MLLTDFFGLNRINYVLIMVNIFFYIFKFPYFYSFYNLNKFLNKESITKTKKICYTHNMGKLTPMNRKIKIKWNSRMFFSALSSKYDKT